jgi:hypothetical protein
MAPLDAKKLPAESTAIRKSEPEPESVFGKEFRRIPNKDESVFGSSDVVGSLMLMPEVRPRWLHKLDAREE